MANTIFITALALFGSIVSASITGFAFARLRFPGRDVWFAILIMTMLIPSAIMIIPQFVPLMMPAVATVAVIEERDGMLAGFAIKLQGRRGRIPSARSMTCPAATGAVVSRENWLDFLIPR